MVETLSAHAAQKALAERIRSRGPKSDFQHFDSCALRHLIKPRPEPGIIISNQAFRSFATRRCFPHLLRRFLEQLDRFLSSIGLCRFRLGFVSPREAKAFPMSALESLRLKDDERFCPVDDAAGDDQWERFAPIGPGAITQLCASNSRGGPANSPDASSDVPCECFHLG